MQSIQERYFADMTCFGCGPANPAGLHLRSFPAPGGTTATFAGWPAHDNGLGFLNGGIISTVLDCHSITPIMIYAEEQGLLGDGIVLPYVTAGLDVRFLRPTPLGPELTLFAAVESADDDVIWVAGELSYDDKVRASVRAQWKRWRPRA
jgi:acyl-coenzyme A thioesterase PaaI-like protein